MQRGAYPVDIMTLDSTGTTLHDEATRVHANTTLALRAGGALSLGHGALGSAAALVVDESGTLVQDSNISLTAAGQLVVRATKGALFKNIVYMEDGLTLTGGAVLLDATPSISMSAAQVSLDALTAQGAFKLKHQGTTALQVDAAGTTITDDA